jgi:glycosyltransferase involved in cell wall biosynthesis
MPEHALALGMRAFPTGGWMPSLANELVKTGGVDLGIASNTVNGQWSEKPVNGKVYYEIPTQTGFKVNCSTLPFSLVQSYLRVIEHFKPDVIHIHGTEFFHGLLTGRKVILTPCVISVQGIIDVCRKHVLGAMPFMDIISSRTLRDWVRFDGLAEKAIKWRRYAKWEREIFASNYAFIGRTQWDKAHTHRLNPRAHYYHCDEILRDPFYEESWNITDISRHSIYTSSASYPLKGFHVLIKAVSLLRRDFPDITVRTPLAGFYHTARGIHYLWKQLRSDGYSKYLTRMIEKEGLERHFFPLGLLEASDVARELKSSHVFVLPSFVENSPNSLGEALSVGTPSVVSFTGGVPSIVKDGVSALCFPPGDATLLADQIRRIFMDDELTTQLSERGRESARARHQRDKIVRQQLGIYESVIQMCRKTIDKVSLSSRA